MPEVVIGKDTATGELITIGDLERRSGLYIVGKPGMGKTEFMLTLMAHCMEHGQGLFFLSPHPDAISDLISHIDTDLIDPDALGDSVLLLDPEHPTHSFGINLLACHDLTSLKERTDTYTRAYSVFYKLWEDSWGPWLQLILQNVLYAFIESPEVTLAEVPAFLDPRNTAFRNAIVNNIRHNPDVADFWRYEFFSRRERNQQERVDAALTRVNTLLIHSYVRHIIGQRHTTLDFARMLDAQQVVLVKLSANLAPDIKKFIGTMLLSELLHAVRNRPEDKRHQFGIFIDEVQNFASSDDFTTLITEARKFGIATTIAHVERYGQLGENRKLLGATAAAANKVFFQLIPVDAREMALEFAGAADEVKTRVGADLVISPRPVEDLWERGHPDQPLMDIRRRYFWIVELLRSKPQETYHVFTPTIAERIASEGKQGMLHWEAFDDWDMYRSSAEMLQEGIALLNQYYDDRMYQKPITNNNYKDRPKTDEEISLIMKVIECVGGVLGFRPVMRPFMPAEKRQLILNAMRDRWVQERKESLADFERHRPDTRIDWHWEEKYPSGAGPMRDLKKRQLEEFEQLKAEGQAKIDRLRRDGLNPDRLPREIALAEVKEVPLIALREGVSAHEAENLIEWEVMWLPTLEQQALRALVTLVANMHVDKAAYDLHWSRVYHEYIKIMAFYKMRGRFGDRYPQLDKETTRPYLKHVTERLVWQMTELQKWILMLFQYCPAVLEREPVHLPSSHYDETPKREKTQGEVIDEIARELVGLPRYTAFAKVIQERGGVQVVLKRKIETIPMPQVPQRYLTDPKYLALRGSIERNTIQAGTCLPRVLIEAELRHRRERWQRSRPSAPEKPKGRDEPPPTSE
jgi:hypothetical protein